MTRAVLLDSFGTLVSMEPPAPRLAKALGVPLERAEAAFRAEIAYYVEHHVEGRDERSLSELRDRCAEVMRDSLGPAAPALADVRAAMLDAIRFGAFPDAAPALRSLRARGLTLVVASNWDCSLPEVLERVGLLPLVDGVVASAVVGADKPAPELFEAALSVAGCSAAEAVHVGDSVSKDVEGARAVGLRALLIDRAGSGSLLRGPRLADAQPARGRPSRGHSSSAVIASLAELPRIL